MRAPAVLLLVVTALGARVHAATPKETATLDASVLDKQPRPLRTAKPEFPPAALEQGIGAEIALLLDVDEKGEVTAVAVMEPKDATGLGFEDAAIAAAYQLAFEPAEIAGKPVAVQITYTFKFAPPKPAPLPPPAAPEVVQPAPVPVKNLGGVLRERGTRLPLGGILVTVYRDDVTPPIGFEAMSDGDGQFAFFNLDPGPWKVLIEAAGYLAFRTTEEIRSGELTQVCYFVERASYNPFDKRVESMRPRKEVTRVVLDTAVIEQVPGAMGDPLTAIQNFAGVARVPVGSGAIIVRGSVPSDTRVSVEGIEIPIAYHFDGARSVLPTGMLASLDFYPGNFGSSYGRATGGIVDVTLKRPSAGRWNGYVDVNLLDSGFFVEAPVTQRLTLMAAARRSYMDAILGAVLPDSAPMKMETAPVYYDYQFLADYRPAPAHDLRLFVFGSDDKMVMLFKNPGELGPELGGNRIGNRTNFQRALVSYRYVPSGRFENALRASVGRDRFDVTLGQFVEHLYADSIQFRDTARLRLGRWATLSSGVDALVQHWTASARMPMPPREGTEQHDLSQVMQTEADEYHWSPGGWAEVEVQPVPRWLLVPGLRCDYFSKIDQATLAPRFSARYAVEDRLAFKAGAGLYYQEPTVDQTNQDFGNPLLKAERALHLSAGVEWKAWTFLSLDVTGFYKALDHLVSPTSTTRTEDGRDIPLRYDNNGEGRAYGLEVVLRREPIHRLSGWLAYTLSRSRRRDSGETSYRLFQHDQTHILTAVGMLRLPANWQLSTRFRLVSGKPATPVIGAVNNLDVDDYKPILGAKFSTRNPAFIQWDLRIDKKWIFDRFLLNAYLDVQNVTNRSNVEEPDYNFDYRRKKTETSMPLYPIFGLRAEF